MLLKVSSEVRKLTTGEDGEQGIQVEACRSDSSLASSVEGWTENPWGDLKSHIDPHERALRYKMQPLGVAVYTSSLCRRKLNRWSDVVVIKCKMWWPGWRMNVASHCFIQENFVYLSGSLEIRTAKNGKFKGKITTIFAHVSDSFEKHLFDKSLLSVCNRQRTFCLTLQ